MQRALGNQASPRLYVEATGSVVFPGGNDCGRPRREFFSATHVCVKCPPPVALRGEEAGESVTSAAATPPQGGSVHQV